MRTMLVSRSLCTVVVVVLDLDVHLYDVDLCRCMSQSSNKIARRELMFKKSSMVMLLHCSASSRCSDWMAVVL